jgi:serine/threonine-protein kinase
MAELPTQIGRYRIERLLGAGSMGNVYLAHDADLDRPVAVKTLRDLALDAEMREVFLSRFRNEARAAALLHHPNIVQIFDVGEDPNVGPYLVFEYVEGRTLKQLLKKGGPLSQERLLEVAQQVGDALATAHSAGVIHRDLKPENLLITDNGQVKLADFGIARVPNADLTKEGQFLGTPCYSAPETLRGGEYSEQSDLFSFGAVLYEAASGERAFPGTEAMAVAHAVMNDSPVPPSEANRGANIPSAVDTTVMRALSKTPGDRYASARTLVAALREAYDGSGASSSTAKRASLRMWIIIALVVLVALWLAIEYLRPEPSPETHEPEAAIDAGTEPESAVTLEAPNEGDAGEETPSLSPHEREEAAKDELARAREAIRGGDFDAATLALDAAEALDPSNPDVDELRSEILAASPDGG